MFKTLALFMFLLTIGCEKDLIEEKTLFTCEELSVLNPVVSGRSAVINSIKSGPWHNTSTWENGNIPGTHDSVIINHSINVEQSTTVGAVTIESGTLNINFGTFQVTDNIQVWGDVQLTANLGSTIIVMGSIVLYEQAQFKNYTQNCDANFFGQIILNGSETQVKGDTENNIEVASYTYVDGASEAQINNQDFVHTCSTLAVDEINTLATFDNVEKSFKIQYQTINERHSFEFYIVHATECSIDNGMKEIIGSRVSSQSRTQGDYKNYNYSFDFDLFSKDEYQALGRHYFQIIEVNQNGEISSRSDIFTAVAK